MAPVAEPPYLVDGAPGALALGAPMVRPVRELADGDHAEKDEADDEHAFDDMRALGSGVEDHAATLAE